VAEANKMAGCLNDTIWRKKQIRAVMIYTAETRYIEEMAEMRISRRISGKTLLHKTKDINERAHQRKIE